MFKYIHCTNLLVEQNPAPSSSIYLQGQRAGNIYAGIIRMLSCQGSGPFRNGSCGAQEPESVCFLNPGNPDQLSQVSAKLLKGEEKKKERDSRTMGLSSLWKLNEFISQWTEPGDTECTWEAINEGWVLHELFSLRGAQQPVWDSWSVGFDKMT